VHKLLFVFLFFGYNVQATQKEINVKSLEKKVIQMTKAFMEEEKVFVGIQAAVLYQNEIIFNEGFGYADIENKKPFLANTIVALGSNTKEFTSVAVQLLKNKGLIRYDDKIEEYLSNELVTKSNVTIKQLLCHTSGMPDFFDISRKYNSNLMTFNRLISAAAKLPNSFSAGDKYEYNNTGYILLGKLIEEISGQSLGDFYRENIIAPLKLKNTYYLGDTIPPINMAKSYDRVDNQVTLFDQTHEDYTEYRISQGAGGLGGSLSDFIKWHTAILKGHLLPMENVGEMLTPCTLNDDSQTKYGLGMEIRTLDNELYYYHNGATNGFLSNALYFPNKELTIAFITNSWENPSKYEKKLISDVLDWLNHELSK